MRTAAIACLAALSIPCAPALAQDDAKAAFRAAFGEACGLDADSAAADHFPDESWTLSWREDISEVDYTGTLHQFFCSAGAYNVNLVYYFEDPLYGLVPVSFATPHYDVKYENDDYEGAVESITVRGFDTQAMLTNAEFDPETRTITDHVLWRGMGDAFASGHWAFDGGQFVLKSYDVDASYDGEQDPERIVEYE